MSTALRCIIGLFVVLCFVQYVEMARIPRDDEAAQKLSSELSADFQYFLDDVTAKFKTAVADDPIKKFFEDFGKAIDGTNKDSKA